MSFISITADELSIYGVTPDGSLVWYRDTARDGTNNPDGSSGWAAHSGSQIGSGWDGFKQVFAGGGGIIYAIKDSGTLHWYRDTLRNGTNNPNGTTGWAPGSGNQIGAGWQNFAKVIYGGDGIIYAIKSTGTLHWYRDTLRNGTNNPNGTTGWAPGSGNQIGSGWQNFTSVVSGGGGVLYTVRTAGTLHWYRDTLRNGTNNPNGTTGWAPGSGNQIGAGWQGFTSVFAPGASDGILYTTTTGSDLRWYQDTLRNGANNPNGLTGWAFRSGAYIGLGWSIVARTMLTGYPVPLSVPVGGSVAVKLSARTATPLSSSVRVVRLRENADQSVGVAVGSPSAVSVTQQGTQLSAWTNGCGWPTTATVAMDPSWPSGYYSARVATADGTDSTDVVFVVRPGAVRKDLLLLANTNCWSAYNGWGGVSNYSGTADVVTLSFERPNPETAPRANLGGGRYVSNHLTAAEIWFATWLEDAGYQFDVCTDLDLHRGDPVLTGYKGLVVTTHPEYWSIEMAARVSDYIAGGGRVLYLGGNGIFRQVIFSPDGRAMTTGSQPPYYTANAWPQGPHARTLLGVGYDLAHDTLYPARCGYVVDTPGHPFFAGTGLVAGSVIGTTGRNGGGACGWEVDCATDMGDGNGPPPQNLVRLAHGQLSTADGYVGDMTYYENPAGGFVFAAGSITMCGSVVVDATLQRIVRNALNACLAPAGAAALHEAMAVPRL